MLVKNTEWIFVILVALLKPVPFQENWILFKTLSLSLRLRPSQHEQNLWRQERGVLFPISKSPWVLQWTLIRFPRKEYEWVEINNIESEKECLRVSKTTPRFDDLVRRTSRTQHIVQLTTVVYYSKGYKTKPANRKKCMRWSLQETGLKLLRIFCQWSQTGYD